MELSRSGACGANHPPSPPSPNPGLILLGWRGRGSLGCPLSPAGLHFTVQAQVWLSALQREGLWGRAHDAFVLSTSCTYVSCISLIQVHSDQSCSFCLLDMSCSPAGSMSHDRGLIPKPCPVPVHPALTGRLPLLQA